jgi:hypothetical protein
MAEKARQHILPQVFQKSFADPHPPSNWPSGRPFEPRIWTIPRTLEGEARPKSPENAFVATHFYTLRTDDRSDPQIERGLANLEDAYGALLPRIRNQDEFTLEDYLKLVVFVGALRARTPHQLDHWQKQFGELERLHRMVERAHTGTEHVSDARFWMGDETAKRMLFEQAESWASVVGPTSWLLANKTPAPFLSSDNPATHGFLHRDELERLGFASDHIPSDALRSDKAFFAYCPLTPGIALVSSPLLLPPDDTSYRETSDVKHVLLLNEYMRHCSTSYLISPLQDPYGPLRPLLRQLDEARRKIQEMSSGIGIIIYTADDRLEFECEEAVHEEGPTPLQSRIRFRTQNTAGLTQIAVGSEVGEVTVYERFRAVSGLRGGRVLSVATTPNESTLIEADVSVKV